MRTSCERSSPKFPLRTDLSCGCSSTRYQLYRGTRCGILTVLQYVESRIVRDDRVETRAAFDHVLHPIGRSDGVALVSAEDLLRSSRKVHCGLGVYGVGALITVHLVLATLAPQAVVLEIFASGSATVVAGTAVDQVVARVAVQLKVVALLTIYLVNRRVAVQVYIVSLFTVDLVCAFAAGESIVARSTEENVLACPAAHLVVTVTAVHLVSATTTFQIVSAEAAFDKVIAPRLAVQPEDVAGEAISRTDGFYHDAQNWREVEGLEPLPEPAALHRVVAVQGIDLVHPYGAGNLIGHLCAPAFVTWAGGASDHLCEGHPAAYHQRHHHS